MKTLAIVMSIVITGASINPLMAGERYGRQHNGYSYERDYGHAHHYDSRYSNRHSRAGRDRRHHSGYGVAYALGGLIVGGIIGAALSQSSVNRGTYPNDKDLSYIAPKTSQYALKPSFIQQPDGSCYVISHVNNGSLVLAPVSTINCQ